MWLPVLRAEVMCCQPQRTGMHMSTLPCCTQLMKDEARRLSAEGAGAPGEGVDVGVGVD